MSNLSSQVIKSSDNSTATLMSLDELSTALGYYPYKEILATFVLPAINVLGLAFCSLSLFIFNKKKFVHPSFFYYRLLCLVYIIQQVHNIPRGILFSPRSNVFPTFLITFSVYTFVPSVAIFVFYSFNKIFREELKKTFSFTKWFSSILKLLIFLY